MACYTSDGRYSGTSRDSPSVTALPPDDGVEMADVDSEHNEHSMLRCRGSIQTGTRSEGGRSSLRTGSAGPPAILFTSPVVRIDDTSVLHPYFPQKSDTGPVQLMTIAHAFNYRMAVLRNGIKSAVRVARARKAEVCFLLNSDIQWGQPIAAMFQIISTMVVELPSCLEELEELSGMPPNVQLKSEPWGHDNHEDMECECQSSDRTAAYIHDLSVNKREPADSPDTDMALNIRPESDWNKRPPRLVPFVFCGPGAYGRLLLAVYERRLTGLVVSSDWLRPVTRGGWRTGCPDRGRGSADVS